MVAAFPATAATAAAVAAASRHNTNPKNADDLQSPHRPPLIPAEKDNAAVAPRRPRHKEVGSRYLSSYGPSPSSSGTSTSYTSSPSSSVSSRRYASPLTSSRTSTASTLPQSASQKRSHSVDRSRTPSAPRLEIDARPALATEPSAAARALCTMTRSLLVSFQGESFFYQTSRARAASPSPARKATPERRRASAAAAAAATNPRVGDYSENSKPFENHHHRWPAAAKVGAANSLMRSMDLSSEGREPIVETVRLLQQSMLFDDATRRLSFDGGDLSTSSDTESVSSDSNSGAAEFGTVPGTKVTSRGISMPARFLQDQSSPLSSLTSRTSVQGKMGSVKKLSVEITSCSPRSASSPLRGHIRSSSPSKVAASPRGVASPLCARNGTTMTPLSFGQPANAPSIISFAAEVRRAKKGENRIEEAHLLRLLDNRHLQWRCVNARAIDVLMQQKLTAEKSLYNAWITVAKMHDSISLKRIKLQILKQNLKLTSILKGQITYLEDWSKIEREHSSSLSAATEALRASTLRLPVVGGAKANVQKVKDAVGSAVDVMQAMTSSLCPLLTKVEGTSSLMGEIAEIAARERMLLNQARLVLSTIAALHVRLCSLQGHLLQLKRKPNRMHIESISSSSSRSLTLHEPFNVITGECAKETKVRQFGFLGC